MGPSPVSATIYAADKWSECVDPNDPNNAAFRPCYGDLGCAQTGKPYVSDGYLDRLGEFVCYVRVRLVLPACEQLRVCNDY